MKRALAKQLDSALEMLFNLRTKGVIPTNEQIARYKEVYTTLIPQHYNIKHILIS